MKKKYIITVIVSVALIAAAIAAVFIFQNKKNEPFKNEVVDALPDYESATIYKNSGDKELIKYAKYIYKDITDETLSKSGKFKKIDTTLDISDMDTLIKATERFDLMLGTLDDANADSVATLIENFDFDLNTGFRAPNYFYVKTVTGGNTDATPAPETCDELHIYYFDIDAQILYYFYANQKEIAK